MAYIVKADLKTHMYQEVIDEIIRTDVTIVDEAIDTAISEVKSYLSRFDLLKLFGNTETEAVVVDKYLKSLVKDIACWHVIKLANPNINLEFFRTIYEDALKFLTLVMKGQTDPEGWFYKVNDADTSFNENQTIQWYSNQKKTQHF